MNRLLGIALLLVGCGLIFLGWQAYGTIHYAPPEAGGGGSSAKSFWLIGAGLLIGGWGVFNLLRGGASHY